jgi:hypothetical protein
MRIFRSILKNARGMSMMEIVVAGGLAGAAAMGVASLMKSMGGSNRDAEMIIERTELGSAIGVFLNSANGCTAFKQGAVVSPTEAPFAIADWTVDGKVKEFKFDGFKNFQTNFDLRYNNIKSLTASRADIAGVNPLTLKIGADTKTLKKAIIKVKLVVTEKSNERDAARKRAEEDQLPETRFEYNIPVMLDTTTNAVEICGDNNSLAESCFILKGIFDSTTGKCQMPEQCQSLGSYTVIDCAPRIRQANNCSQTDGRVATVNPVTNGFNCPPGAQAVSTGGDTWYRDVNCGKKCTARINYSLGYYSCLKCE